MRSPGARVLSILLALRSKLQIHLFTSVMRQQGESGGDSLKEEAHAFFDVVLFSSISSLLPSACIVKLFLQHREKKDWERDVMRRWECDKGCRKIRRKQKTACVSSRLFSLLVTNIAEFNKHKGANVFYFLSSLPLLSPPPHQPPRQCLAPTCHLSSVN